MIVAVVNTGIAIFQEIKSKKSLDKLRIVAAPAVKVVRDGKETEISVEEIVLDDVMKLETGVQICADAVVLEGQTEVNESMLTGESESVVKKKGDTLFAGSYVVSGACLARADKIAEANYIEGLTSRARKYKKAALAAARRSQNHTQGRCGDYHTDDLLYVADQLYDISGFGAEQ